MEEDSEPIQPFKFYFSHTEYGKSCTLASRCDDSKTISFLKDNLEEAEKNWFIHHPQFQHIWHMHRQRKRKVMGMLMLLLRTSTINKKRVCWFIVNGVPIKYSLKEHGLICGLDCRSYPPNYDILGSFQFVERNFGRNNKILVSEVKEKLVSMGACRDRLNMAVLLFLSTIIKGNKIVGTIDPFLLRVVDDLEACKTFPWGRFTFENSIKEIFHMINHFKGSVKRTWSFPGFIIPLELLAFECILNLKKKFREGIIDVKSDCPKMCKGKWKDKYSKGISLDEINEALGTTKDIHSILEPTSAEESLMAQIMGDDSDDDLDAFDPIVDGWEKRLRVERKTICWEELYNLDVASRGEVHLDQLVPPQPLDDLKNLEDKIMKAMQDGFSKIHENLDGLEARLVCVESFVSDSLSAGSAGKQDMDWEGFEIGGPSSCGEEREECDGEDCDGHEECAGEDGEEHEKTGNEREKCENAETECEEDEDKELEDAKIQCEDAQAEAQTDRSNFTLNPVTMDLRPSGGSDASEVEAEISDGISPLDTSHRDVADEGSLLRKAGMYQDYMKQVPIPKNRGSVIPFTSWVGLSMSIKQLYGQPLHYLTNVLIRRWDQSRFGADSEDQSLDSIIHPSKAEATIWLLEEIHRNTASPLHIAHLWKSDHMYHSFIDPIFPELRPLEM